MRFELVIYHAGNVSEPCRSDGEPFCERKFMDKLVPVVPQQAQEAMIKCVRLVRFHGSAQAIISSRERHKTRKLFVAPFQEILSTHSVAIGQSSGK